MASVHPRYVPFPYQDSPQSGRLILRDGSTATIRVTRPSDKKAMAEFFVSLSETSTWRRFFSSSGPTDKMIQSFCDSSKPRERLSLIVTRLLDEREFIIAVGTYVARDQSSAEVAFTVQDRFQGKGIGALLLERLAILAVSNGIQHFWAMTMMENQPMLDVFRNSGFECRSRLDQGYVEIDLSVIPSEASVARADWRDRVATTASLRPFFLPRSVAVLGASRNPANIGARILAAITKAGFKGPVYPINRNASSIGSLPAYPSLRDLPVSPELVVIAVPRDAVLDSIDDCAARGVRAVIVITAGFAEIGPEGRELQRKLLEKVRGCGMRMVGPNCLGLLNTDPAVRLNASFAPQFPSRGNVAFCSQSGALGLAIISQTRKRQLGISSFISVGNKADVSGNDLLQYWDEDKQTDVILLYLESFGNPRRFARIAQRVSRHKPIVVVKAGRTAAGHRAASSHTAALAAADVAVDALFLQTGVIRAETLDEMFDLAAALSHQPLPPGSRVGIITNAGGLGILCADECEAAGLTVQELGESTRNLLREFLPMTASVTNPVDMIASASAADFRKAVEILLSAEEVDSLIVLTIDVALVDMTAIAAAVHAGAAAARLRGGTGKPVFTCLMDGEKARHVTGASGERFPDYEFPESAARVLGKLARYSEWRRRPEDVILDFDDIQPATARGICQQALETFGEGWLSAEDARKVLSAFALPMPPGSVCRTAEEAIKVAEELGFPVAVKLASRTIIHKSDIGGVRLALKDAQAVREAFEAMCARLTREQKLDAMDGVLVQPMVPSGVELMVGVTQDPLFGPLLAFGLGGIHVEILKDVCFRVTPITARDAGEMVRSIRGYRLLQGYRGHPAADIAAVENVLLRIARLVEEVPEISELDLNPIIALPPGQGCLIIDTRIRVAPLH